MTIKQYIVRELIEVIAKRACPHLKKKDVDTAKEGQSGV